MSPDGSGRVRVGSGKKREASGEFKKREMRPAQKRGDGAPPVLIRAHHSPLVSLLTSRLCFPSESAGGRSQVRRKLSRDNSFPSPTTGTRRPPVGMSARQCVLLRTRRPCVRAVTRGKS